MKLNSLEIVRDDVLVNTCHLATVHPNAKVSESLDLMMLLLGFYIFKVKINWHRKQTLLGTKILLDYAVFKFRDYFSDRRMAEQ